MELAFQTLTHKLIASHLLGTDTPDRRSCDRGWLLCAPYLPALPKPSYVPDRSDWTMTCQSATSGKTYEVSLFTNGKIAVGPNTYSYDGNWAKNGAGSYLAKGKTRYGHFVAVFHSTNPQR
jgi:hypothetical protein